MEAAHPMECTVSDTFNTDSTSNLGDKELTSLNDTFDLFSQDISLVSNILTRKSLGSDCIMWYRLETIESLYLTTMNNFDREAASISTRNSSYQLDTAKLQPDNLYIGDKALIYAHAHNFNVHENFW